jgi:hypothetical protein
VDHSRACRRIEFGVFLARTPHHDSQTASSQGEDYQHPRALVSDQEYVFLDFEELILMTSFADYHRALPALSRSLYRVFAQKLFWVSDCDGEEISKVLNAAIKLLHPGLFQKCIIIIAGQWDTEPGLRRYDWKIQKLINAARNRIGYNIAEAEKQILLLTAQSDHLQTETSKVKFTACISFPEYHRNLKDGQGTINTCDYGDLKDELHEALARLLEDNLQFGGSHHNSVGNGELWWGTCLHPEKL